MILLPKVLPPIFLDYIALHKNIPTKVEKLYKVFVDGCLQANTALIGGETAEMPMYMQKIIMTWRDLLLEL